jgi:hypothetical protein
MPSIPVVDFLQDCIREWDTKAKPKHLYVYGARSEVPVVVDGMVATQVAVKLPSQLLVQSQLMLSP